MITLKAALIAASAVGTVAVGGGATWAMTGTHHEAGLQSNGAKAPAATRGMQHTAPKTLPTCIPAKPGLPKGKLPATGLPKADIPRTGVKKQVEQHLKQNPATKNLPKTGLPKTKVPGAKVPGVDAPGVKSPDVKGPLPANLPACAPSAPGLPAGAPAPRPSAAAPAKPGLPAVPKLDCSKLVPAVKVGGTVEKAVMLPKGLRYTSAASGSAELRKRKICAVTQKWTGRAGQWLTVETLKTPAGMTQNELRQALRLPEGGSPVTVAGFAGWRAPNGNGVLLFDPNGYALFVDGSPVLAGGLRDVATAVGQAR